MKQHLNLTQSPLNQNLSSLFIRLNKVVKQLGHSRSYIELIKFLNTPLNIQTTSHEEDIDLSFDESICYEKALTICNETITQLNNTIALELESKCKTMSEDKVEREESLKKTVSKLERRVKKYVHQYDCERKTVSYYKKKLQAAHNFSDDEVKLLRENIAYYENLMEELKEKIDLFDSDFIIFIFIDCVRQV